jgi:flavin-dependent dehydrogenase
METTRQTMPSSKNRQTAQFDVVILGGGPAGTATALCLAQHAPSLSLALVERSRYDQPRIGETLPPGGQRLLEHLGVWDEFCEQAHLAAYGTRSSWASAKCIDNDFIYSTLGDGWHLDRRRFDRMLCDAAQRRGAVVFSGTRVTAVDKAGTGEWLLPLDDRTRHELRATFVVDATGRLAWFAKRCGAASVTIDRLVGLFRLYRFPTAAAHPDTFTQVEPAEDGWWYGAALPHGRAAVAFMTDADLARRRQLKDVSAWQAALDQTEHTSAFVREAEPLGGPAVHAASSRHLDQVTGSDWLAVGDAASTFDPLSSLGILKALQSGIFAAYAIADHLRGDPSGLKRYAGTVRQGFERYLHTREAFYFRETRWPDNPFWRRRRQTISLDPLQTLRTVDPAHIKHRNEAMYLPAADLQHLGQLCLKPKAAHEIVAAFQTARPGAASDRRIVLALQHLIEQGHLATDD